MITTQTAPVRLTPQQVDAIRAAVADIFGPTAGVWLFGSRADLSRRGGDIDLYIEAPCDGDTACALTGQLYARLQRHLGEQRIDIVTRTPDQPEEPIHRVARTNGVRL